MFNNAHVNNIFNAERKAKELERVMTIGALDILDGTCEIGLR
jgi:hypothetical protein